MSSYALQCDEVIIMVLISGNHNSILPVIITTMKTIRLHHRHTSRKEDHEATISLEFFGCMTQTFQNPLIKEYTLSYNRIPNMI